MTTEDSALVAAATAGDQRAFSELTERYRTELRVHCYRLVGSFDEAEDLVQETFLRAWRKRGTYAGRSTFRAWLYRIATNAGLDVLDRRPRDPLAGSLRDGAPPPAAVAGLQPFPDRLLDQVESPEAGPDARVVAKETIELAFLAAIQQLPPRQRAVLILRDVLGWRAAEVADLLDTSTASVNSALQRARQTLQGGLPRARSEWTAGTPSEQDRAVLDRYLAAIERNDDAALGELLSDDVRCSQQPWAGGNMTPDPIWYRGRATVVRAWQPLFHGEAPISCRAVATAANRQPAFGMYVRTPDMPAFAPFGLTVLGIGDGVVTEISVFHPDVFAAFGLPESL
ncbi:RNA polymerase subunit sigma-70 [Amycolatopsis suaedae]|uniref:RNA polymerase sigma factor n=1 Tax=Amycolatopsis suaedae TaxID=2510978 RepID=A0A4Q7JGP1_9PSEU|nr:RNA polymerase subunit sigma-70 [Amycolatopsis suaedae]RZQ66034.1 sigma-70 family RNA polymerase sigma factor [Amycolatopsis suaedae]